MVIFLTQKFVFSNIIMVSAVLHLLIAQFIFVI